MENMKLACSEVYCILEILGDTYKNKLPAKFLEFINQNRNLDYTLEINEEEYENLKISKDGLILISFLNLKYWEDDEKEKQRLIEIYENNDKKRQEKLNRYKQSDWLRQTKENLNDIAKTNENTQVEIKNQSEEKQSKPGNELIEVKKSSIFDKIKMIIKKIFNKKKE